MKITIDTNVLISSTFWRGDSDKIIEKVEAKELELISKEHSTYFFNANDVTAASVVDGIHLDENQHQILGKAIAHAISETKIF